MFRPCVCLFLILICKINAESEIDGFFKLVVEHTFDGNVKDSFTRRGIININSLKSGRGDIHHDVQLSNDEIRKLKDLADADGFYHIRVAKMSSSESTPDYVHSFVKACSLLESGLSDRIAVYLDSFGSLVGASLTTNAPYCSKGSDNLLQDENFFETAIEVHQPSIGPSPETDFYIKKLEQEKQQAKGQQVDNRSFFVKYWMYIVPVFIFVMVLNNVDPGAGQGGAR